MPPQWLRLGQTKTILISRPEGAVYFNPKATLRADKHASAINKHFANIRFDLVLYSTPPVTFTRIVNAIKHRDKAVTYLLLKDIFPQNAVDLGMIKKGGLLHRFFLRKEKSLYRISDYIGCMSPANVTYLLQHNPDLDPAKVEVNPNSIEINAADASSPDKSLLRLKFGLPEDKTLFIYGGNPGKPQGLDFLLKVIENTQDLEKVFFLIIGSVTEYPKLKRWFNQNKPKNALLFESAPKADFDLLVQSCDVGMIFLDGRFTIPNFPSRLLTYLECSKPVISATDKNTDIGTIMEENGFGLWCESGDTQRFMANMKTLMADPEKAKAMGKNGRAFLEKNYLVSDAYQTIMKHFENV